MRAVVTPSFILLALGLLPVGQTATGQVIKVAPAIQILKPAVEAKKDDGKDGLFDQRKEDLETIKSGGLTDDVKSLTDFFRNHTVTADNKVRLLALIKQLGDETFETREAASDTLSKSGIAAIALLRNGMKDPDYEIVRRCEVALKIIEKVPTRSLSIAAARLLTKFKDDGITEVLMNYLPLSDEDAVTDEIRNTFAALAVRAGKPDSVLEAALQSKDALKRGAAAEAFARANDKDSRARMKALLKTEADADIKLLIALALVTEARDKEVVPDVIRLMPDVSTERGWRAEEVLWRLAGDGGPNVALGGDKAGREKARDEWKKWWDANGAKIDVAKQLDAESSFGLTIVCETPTRGGLGRVVALGGDLKPRWTIKNLNWPMDALPLAGKRVLIAEFNSNQVSEREIDGKVVWTEQINQPSCVGRLTNGTTWAVGRNQIIEWERGEKGGKKQVFSFIRNEYDIVAGARTKNGEYVLLTQSQQLLKVDRKGAIVKSHGVGGNGVPQFATVDLLPTGKALVTLQSNLIEYDIESGKAGWTANYQFATSAVRLRTGNTLVGSQNQGKIVELDKDGKATKWEYKGAEPGAFRPYRAFKR